MTSRTGKFTSIGLAQALACGPTPTDYDGLAALTGDTSTADDPHRASVIAFVESQLVAAVGVAPLPQRKWVPDQADGRDASGTVHVSVRDNEIVILEAPPEIFERSAESGAAIREALNLALKRRERDGITLVERRDRAATQSPPDWRELAARASELG